MLKFRHRKNTQTLLSSEEVMNEVKCTNAAQLCKTCCSAVDRSCIRYSRGVDYITVQFVKEVLGIMT